MRILILIILLGVNFSATASDALSEQGIINYHIVNQDIATSGAPTTQQLIALSEQGIKTIIDLRTEQEGTDAEERVVENLGMHYINIPVTGAGINDEQIIAFAEAMKNIDRPILIHCASGNRVGAMWTSYQLSKDVPADKAFAEGRAIGMKPSLEEKVKAACQNC